MEDMAEWKVNYFSKIIETLPVTDGRKVASFIITVINRSLPELIHRLGDKEVCKMFEFLHQSLAIIRIQYNEKRQ